MTSQHHDPIQDNIDSHPVKLAIAITLGAVAVVIGIIMLVQYVVGSYGTRDLTGDPSMSDAAVKRRTAPVPQRRVDPNAPAAAPAAAAPATPAAAPAAMPPAAPVKTAAAGAGSGAGKSTYDSACA